jgi:hypothetical protein
MKKRFLALGMAAAMVVASSVTSFAGTETITAKGEIAENDIKISITLPAVTSLTIQPYAKTQISSGKAVGLINDSTGTSAVAYDVEIAGYTATVGGKGEVKPTLSATKTTTFTGTKKDMSIEIEFGTISAKTSVVGTSVTQDEFDAFFSTPTAAVHVAKISEADYDKTKSDSTYTKATETTNKVTVTNGDNNAAPFRITGALNATAAWEVGDSVTITPVFKITPNVDATVTA